MNKIQNFKNKFLFIEKLMSVLSKEDKYFLFFLLVFSVFISIIETVGISAIMPFIAVASDFNLIESNEYYNKIYKLFSFETYKDFIIAFGVVLIVFYIARSSINIIYFHMLNKFSEGRYQIIATKLFQKYMKMEFKYFVQKNSSTLTKTIMHESSHLTSLIQQILLMFSEIFILIFIYIMLLYVNYEITITLTILLILNGLLLTQTISKPLKKLGVIRANMQTKFYEVINKSFGNFKIIKLSSNDKFMNSEFKETSINLVNANIKAATLTQFPKLFLEAIGFSIIILIVIYLIWKNNGDISSAIAMLSVFILALYRLLPSVNRIMSSYNSIMFQHKALDIIYEDLMRDHEILGKDKIEFKESIKLKELDFYYNKNKLIFDNINICINKGDKVAFIGESGSGKSTIVDLIIGLHHTRKNTIFIDNIPLGTNNLESWRKKIGYIPQSVYLFDGSISDNVVFGREYNEHKVIEVLKKAEIYSYLEEKDGLSTQVGEGGSLLSGGQRQRIAIARALYGDPEILVLDEATSALDNDTEKRIMDEVYKVSKDMTLIIIAHRLSTIDRCNKIYKLNKGRIE